MPEQIVVTLKTEDTNKEYDVSSSLGGGASTTLDSKQARQNKQRSNLSAVGTYVGMRMVSYAVSNIGKWTGSRQTQIKVNKAQQIFGIAGMTLANPLMGIAVVATTAATSIADYMYEKKIDDIRSQQALNRIGSNGGYRR